MTELLRVLDYSNELDSLEGSSKGLSVETRLRYEKERAATLLAEGKTQTRVAEILGRTKQTINGWCKEPEFQAAVERFKSDALREVEKMLEGGLPSAARAVLDIIQSNNNPEEDSRALTARLKAALWLLDQHKKSKLPTVRNRQKPLPLEDTDLDEIMTRVEKK